MAPKKKPEAAEGDVVTVTWRGGERVYTRDLHGEDFRALAEEFATKKGGTVL